MRISDWSSDVCSSDLDVFFAKRAHHLVADGVEVGLQRDGIFAAETFAVQCAHVQRSSSRSLRGVLTQRRIHSSAPLERSPVTRFSTVPRRLWPRQVRPTPMRSP